MIITLSIDFINVNSERGSRGERELVRHVDEMHSGETI